MGYLRVRCPKGKRWNRRSRRCVLLKVPHVKLARGAQAEAREHPWASPSTARKIARDHLTENPRAYGEIPARDLARFKPEHRWQVEELYRRLMAKRVGARDQLAYMEQSILAQTDGKPKGEDRVALRAIAVIRKALGIKG